MSITDSTPYMSAAFVTEFLLQPREIQRVTPTPEGPKLVATPNPKHWVSDDAMDRAHRIITEKDAALKRRLADMKRDQIGTVFAGAIKEAVKGIQ